ncbi:hypothetical protein [Aquimarina sp. 2304DJ70-9]|uniref:hypothetical protein n=1 Tax=Aquimarina penaris TaxID=3231044 RepID=UPI00346236CE
MKYIHILFCCFLYLSTFSQEEFKVKKGKTFFEEKKYTYLEHIVEDPQGGYVLLRPDYAKFLDNWSFKGYFVEHYDRDLNMLKLGKYGNKKTKILGGFIKDDKLYVIEDLSDLKAVPNKKIKVVVNASSLKKLDFEEKEILYINLREKYGHLIDFFEKDEGPISRKDFLKFKFSQNKKSFAMSFHLKVKELEYHNIYAFDDNLEQLYTNEIVLKSKDHTFEFDDIVIDDEDQSTYLVGKNYPNMGSVTPKEHKMNFEIYKFNTSFSISTKVSIGEGTVNQLFPFFHEDRLFFITAFQDESDTSKKGFTFLEVDKKNLETTKQFFIPIKQQMLNNNLKGIEKIRVAFNHDLQNKDLFNFRVKSIDITKNGDFVLVAEEHYQYIQSSQHHSVLIDYHGAILTVRFNEDGNLKTATLIHKNQHDAVQRSNFNSIINFYHNDKMHYVFNYKRKKEAKKGDKIEYKGSGSVKPNLVMLTLDQEGNVYDKDIVPYSEQGVHYMVKNGFFNKEENRLLLFGNNPKGKKKQLMVLDFN